MHRPIWWNVLKTKKIAIVLLLWVFLVLTGCQAVIEQVKSSLGTDPEQELQEALTRTPAQWKGAMSLAASVDPKVTEGQKLNQDHVLNQRLQAMVDRLKAVSHAPEIPFRVKTIDSKQINAFNTGGELLYVYTGLIHYVGSDDELAGILAHEMAHGIAAHLQRERRSMLLPSLGALLTSIALQNRNADQVIGLVNQAISSGYSRRHEREADILAVVYTYRAGYNPLSFEDFFRRISRQAQNVKQEKESGLRQVYALYQQTSRKLEKAKQANAASLQYFKEHPNSPAARDRLQRTQKDLKAVQQEHGQQYQRYKQAYQSYAQSITELFPFFQSHPSDPERINIVTNTYQYLKSERALGQTPSQVQYVMKVVERSGKK
ncbi:MAG: M48 family metallopeptidase [bacterium]